MNKESTISPEAIKEAREIVEKFKDFAYVEWNGGENEMTNEEAAKQCAIIHIQGIIDVYEDEIIPACCSLDTEMWLVDRNKWLQVKQAIEQEPLNTFL